MGEIRFALDWYLNWIAESWDGLPLSCCAGFICSEHMTECRTCRVFGGWLTDTKSPSWKRDHCVLTSEVSKIGLIIPFPGGGPVVEGDGFLKPVLALMRFHHLTVSGLIPDYSYTSLCDSLQHTPTELCYPGICLRSIFRNIGEWRSFHTWGTGKAAGGYSIPSSTRALQHASVFWHWMWNELAQNCICIFPESLFCTSVSVIQIFQTHRKTNWAMRILSPTPLQMQFHA